MRRASASKMFAPPACRPAVKHEGKAPRPEELAKDDPGAQLKPASVGRPSAYGALWVAMQACLPPERQPRGAFIATTVH